MESAFLLSSQVAGPLLIVLSLRGRHRGISELVNTGLVHACAWC